MSTQKDSLVLVKLASFAVRKGVQVLVNLSVFHAFSRVMIGLKAAPVLRFRRSAPPVSVQDTETGAWAQVRPQVFDLVNARECVQRRKLCKRLEDARRHCVQQVLLALRGSVGEG